jgi:antitoxin CcdA
MEPNMRTKDGAARRAVNLTIRADLLDEAKRLKLNASRAAEAGLLEAVRRARIEGWRRENAAAIDEYNRRLAAGDFDEFLHRF